MAREKVQPAAEEAERRLIEAAARDPGRFAELYAMHFHRIYAFVSGRVHDRAAAEDLTAEVFQRALAHLPRFQWRGVPFAAWLYRIAARAVADHGRRIALEQSLPAAGDFANPAAPAEAEVDAAERRARLFRLVDALPADQRRVLLLRFTEDKAIREIAHALGRSEGAVKQLQFRALETLRARMAEEAHG